ncbi:MAG: hypothetical protein HKN14_04075 [Marinicaulis sp.]|nr:hypothetical protein [Marinicaulis sp.]
MVRATGTFLATAAASAAVMLAAAASAATFQTDQISFRDITGSVEIVTTTGDEIDVEIRQGDKFSSVELAEVNGVVMVTGEKWRDDETRDCCDQRITREFHARRGRKITTGEPVDEAFFEEYPTIVVSMPVGGDVEFLDARIRLDMEKLNGALSLDACYVYGQTSDVEQATIGIVDGSRLVIGNVAAGLEVDVSGDADLRVGNAAMADIDVAGPGDVLLGDIDGMLDVSIAGSGIVRSTRVDGPVTARIAGSGGLAIKAGRADKLKATIDGSGGVYFGGNVNQPELRLYGSSEVRMRSVSGRVVHYGSGDVYVGDKVFGADEDESD